MFKRVALAVAVMVASTLISLAVAELFVADDSIPGYVHRNGAGSRVDVRADGTYDGTGWTVALTRSLRTGDPAHDIQFSPGETYDFQVATWDNAGDSAHDITEASNVYSMTIPESPGPVAVSGTPSILTALSGELLASDEIRITVSWTDATWNDMRRRWSFDGSDWMQSSENEDRVALIWDLQEDAFASAGTCLTMCHPPDMMYTAPGTFVDTWHWKATRTNPSGYSDDKYWDDGDGGTASGRHNDPGQAPYMDNVAGSLPAYMAESDPGANATFLFDFPEGTMEALPWTDGAWSLGDTLPGYVGRRGSGSRVDTRATSAHDGTGWTVTIRRKLDTGNDSQDITFVPGGTYYFQVTTWDNAGDSAHDISGSNTVYSMTIPNAPGPLAFSSTPGVLTSLTGELLDSDEIEVTATWTDATRSDVRKQWSFDGDSWTQSSHNEDRVAFIWDMQGDEFMSAGSCATMCHLPDMMYTAPGTFVDTWHWKATRTGATRFCDDKYWDDGNDGTESGRRNDSGTSVYKDNAPNGDVPTYMSAAGPGFSAKFLFDHGPAAGWSRAIPFDSGEAPPPPDGPSFSSPDLPDFLFWVRITNQAGGMPDVRREPLCIEETICVSGALEGRSEVFLRVVGPKPNGFLWPTFVRFTTSQVEIWVKQVSTDQINYYLLEAAERESPDLTGYFDRTGFTP